MLRPQKANSFKHASSLKLMKKGKFNHASMLRHQKASTFKNASSLKLWKKNGEVIYGSRARYQKAITFKRANSLKLRKKGEFNHASSARYQNEASSG